jgi:hypothetical protein
MVQSKAQTQTLVLHFFFFPTSANKGGAGAQVTLMHKFTMA